MINRRVVIGSRGSELALWQARWVQQRLQERFDDLEITITIIKTTGDRILDAPLSKIGDKGLFTREIEAALLRGEIDIAVHSLKDLPTRLPHGLVLGAVTEREDVRDVFIPHPQNPTRTLLSQAEGAQIATGSLRRKCQLLNLRPDVKIVDIRGNLNTRVKKLDESAWAGMLLARAGVVRLGWIERIGETLDPLQILPAVGQGALGVEIREGDRRIEELVSVVHHPPTAQATLAERALLRTLEGGCQIPIGAYGRVLTENGVQVLKLDAMVGSLDGTTVLRASGQGPGADAERIGEQVARSLLQKGADRILEDIRRMSLPQQAES